jgi:hypothetical protein
MQTPTCSEHAASSTGRRPARSDSDPARSNLVGSDSA